MIALNPSSHSSKLVWLPWCNDEIGKMYIVVPAAVVLAVHIHIEKWHSFLKTGFLKEIISISDSQLKSSGLRKDGKDKYLLKTNTQEILICIFLYYVKDKIKKNSLRKQEQFFNYLCPSTCNFCAWSGMPQNKIQLYAMILDRISSLSIFQIYICPLEISFRKLTYTNLLCFTLISTR